MTLYRIFPHRADAAAHDPGGALYIPPQGHGRADNPALYRVLYVADSPAGAVAEVFNIGGYRQRWSANMLRSRAGSTLALGTYELGGAARICDLDDGARLTSLELRPSNIVTREYARTRRWAATIFELRRFAGVRWWSYQDARWGSIGLWSTGDGRFPATCVRVEQLTLEHPALLEAASVLSIEVLPSRAPLAH